MIGLREALVNKSNIKKIISNRIFDSYKKKDLKVGDICFISKGYIGMVITVKISDEMEIFSLPDYDKDDKIIIFNDKQFHNKCRFCYISLDMLDDNLKDNEVGYDFSVKKVCPQQPPKDVFSSKEKLYNYLEQQTSRNIFEL